MNSTKMDIRLTYNRQKTTKKNEISCRHDIDTDFWVDMMSTWKFMIFVVFCRLYVDLMSILVKLMLILVDDIRSTKTTSCRHRIWCRQKSRHHVDQNRPKVDQNWSTSCRQTTPDRHQNDTRGEDDTCLFYVDFGVLHVDKLSLCCWLMVDFGRKKVDKNRQTTRVEHVSSTLCRQKVE